MISFKKLALQQFNQEPRRELQKEKFLFCLPGSPSACADAWDNILKFQLDSRFEPCNLIDLMPRISDK